MYDLTYILGKLGNLLENLGGRRCHLCITTRPLIGTYRASLSQLHRVIVHPQDPIPLCIWFISNSHVSPIDNGAISDRSFREPGDRERSRRVHLGVICVSISHAQCGVGCVRRTLALRCHGNNIHSHDPVLVC